MEEKKSNFFSYMALFFIMIVVVLIVIYANDNSIDNSRKSAIHISIDSVYKETSKQKIKNTKILLGFRLLDNKNEFSNKESKLIIKNIITKRYFSLLDAYGIGYDFKFKNVSFFGCLYPHFYKNKLYNLEIQLFRNEEDNSNIDIHESMVNLYRVKYKSWYHVQQPGSDYWFKDGKMIIIHDNVVNYIVPKYEILYKKHIENKKNREANKTLKEI